MQIPSAVPKRRLNPDEWEKDLFDEFSTKDLLLWYIPSLYFAYALLTLFLIILIFSIFTLINRTPLIYKIGGTHRKAGSKFVVLKEIVRVCSNSNQRMSAPNREKNKWRDKTPKVIRTTEHLRYPEQKAIGPRCPLNWKVVYSQPFCYMNISQTNSKTWSNQYTNDTYNTED